MSKKPEHMQHSDYADGYAAGFRDAYKLYCDVSRQIRKAEKARKARRKK